MRIACIQMDVAFEKPEENFRRAALLAEQAAKEKPDVIVLPETWNTGFFPAKNLLSLSDPNGERTREQMGALAARLSVNLVAGSVSRRLGERVYNTAYVFDRTGACVAEYDKTHLFSPMGEDKAYAAGSRLCRFSLDGVPCALIICYDLRFPELTRRLALSGAQLLFVVSQWPAARLSHLRTLAAARAIENQLFLACCNACGTAGETVYGGGSVLLDPLGAPLAQAGAGEEAIFADCDFSQLSEIRAKIPVYTDRRPALY